MAKKPAQTGGKPQKRTDGTWAPGNTIGNRWKPGESGNPSGPLSKRPLTDAIKRRLADPKEVEDLIRVAFRKARAGDFRFWEELIKRVDGKVLDQLDITSNGERIGLPGLSPEILAAARKVKPGPDA
ncbi:MAG TPA: DUF5681 domain-containing protein [Phycisphaerae bacterium]|nr:DUF5681 domain-containing protein [Phycisphaerae bacterium]